MSEKQRSPTPEDLLTLSAYIDGDLSPPEQAELETRLNEDEALRIELESLQQTVTALQTLPPIKAPRDFTLDPATYGQKPPTPNVIPFLTRSRVIGALAAVASLIIVFAIVLAIGNDDGADTETQSDQVSAVAMDNTPASSGADDPAAGSTDDDDVPEDTTNTVTEAPSVSAAQGMIDESGPPALEGTVDQMTGEPDLMMPPDASPPQRDMVPPSVPGLGGGTGSDGGNGDTSMNDADTMFDEDAAPPFDPLPTDDGAAMAQAESSQDFGDDDALEEADNAAEAARDHDVPDSEAVEASAAFDDSAVPAEQEEATRFWISKAALTVVTVVARLVYVLLQELP